MKTYARLVDGIAVEIIEPFVEIIEAHTAEDGTEVPRSEREVPIEERFHPDIVAQLVKFDPAAGEGT